MKNLCRRIYRRVSGRGYLVSQEQWDKEYRDGVWDVLADFSRLSRYSIIAGYCRHLDPTGIILDVGCGTGLLLDSLGSVMPLQYTGIDVSGEAIDRALRAHPGGGAFLRAGAQSYQPARKFNIIVFNESLYYSPAPAALLERYESFLGAGGYFIVSMVESSRNASLWRSLMYRYVMIDETRFTNRLKKRFLCRVLAPKSVTPQHGKNARTRPPG